MDALYIVILLVALILMFSCCVSQLVALVNVLKQILDVSKQILKEFKKDHMP